MADPEQAIGIVAVSGTFGAVTLGIICITLYKSLKIIRETSLKRRLVETGFSAPEIEMVLNAGNRKRRKAAPEQPIAAKKVPPKAAAYT